MPILPKKVVALFKKYKDAEKRGRLSKDISREEKELLEKFDLIRRDLQPGNGNAIRRSVGSRKGE